MFIFTWVVSIIVVGAVAYGSYSLTNGTFDAFKWSQADREQFVGVTIVCGTVLALIELIP